MRPIPFSTSRKVVLHCCFSLFFCLLSLAVQSQSCSAGSTLILFENFESCAPPAGWIFEETNPGGGTGWYFDGDPIYFSFGYSGPGNPIDNCWAVYRNDLQSGRTATIGSPALDLTGLDNVNFSFYYGYDDKGAQQGTPNPDDFMQLWIYNPNTFPSELYWDGVSGSWETDPSTIWLTDNDSEGTLSFSIPSDFVEDNEAFQVFIRFDDAGGQGVGFAIDDFQVCGVFCNISFPSTNGVIFNSPVTCAGQANLTIDLDDNAPGTGPYDVILNGTDTYNGFASEPISIDIPNGTYTSVQVIDANGCTVEETGNWSVQEPNGPVFAGVTFNDAADCNSSGSVLVNLLNSSLGQPPYTVVLNGTDIYAAGATEPFSLSIPLGSYFSVEVIDADNCSSIRNGSWIVSLPPSPEFRNSTNGINFTGATQCDVQGTLYVDLKGSAPGTPPYRILLDGIQVAANENTLPITIPIDQGSYSNVQIIDDNNCSDTRTGTWTVSEPEFIASISEVNPTCGIANGTAEVEITVGSGDYTFTWTGSTSTTATATDLAPGNHSVMVTDNNTNCTTDFTINLTNQGTPVSVTTSATAPTGCTNDGTATATPTGGTNVTYLWNDGQTTSTITNLGAGSYIVTITNIENGVPCNTVETVTIPAGPGGIVEQTGPIITPVSCNGGASGSITGLTYNGGTPPYSYGWTEANSPFTSNSLELTGLEAGTYSLTLTDSGSCDFTLANVVVDQPTAILPTYTSTKVNCDNDPTAMIDLVLSGGTIPYSYLWSNGEITEDLNNLTQGTYTVTITDGNDCVEILDAVVDSESDLIIAIQEDNPVTCFEGEDGAATAMASGGVGTITYLWDNGETTATAINLAAGIHSVSISDDLGCQRIVQVAITQPDLITATSSTTAASCLGLADGTATLTPIGGNAGFSFAWPGGQNTATVNNLDVGTYTVTITDSEGCVGMHEVTIGESSPISLANQTDDVRCNGESNGQITITPNNGSAPFNYNWSNGDISDNIDNLEAGDYQVTATDNIGCKVVENYTVNEPDVLVLTADNPTNLCGQTLIPVTASTTGGNGNYDYMWSDGNITPTVNVNVNTPYSVTVTDNKGCEAGIAFEVGNLDAPAIVGADSVNIAIKGGMEYFIHLDDFYDVDANYDWTVTESGDNVMLAETSGSTDGLLSELLALVNETYLETVTYVITPYLEDNTFRCEGETLKITVTVLPNNALSFFIPEIITPNGDGKNDIWQVTFSDDNPSDYSYEIYNRNGVRVAENTCDNPWDGSDGPDGVYWYRLLDENGGEVAKGGLTVIRK